MKFHFLKSSLIAVLVYLPVHSIAWGILGHRIVGEIAQTYLTEIAKNKIRKILGTETIAMAGNWADFIKSDTSYKYLNSWHYIDFDGKMEFPEMQAYLKKDEQADAYTKLKFLVNELKKNNLPIEKKRMYLRLLIHITEDVHQPMHVSLKGDQGGNDIKVQWFGQSSNLHHVWDEQLIDDQKLSYTEYAIAINHISINQKKEWQNEPITKWVYDSYIISQNLHLEITQSNQKLGYDYNFHHLQLLNDQLLKGGIHLAKILNSIFK